VGAQGVRVLWVFLWVYSFLWVHGFSFGSTFMFFFSLSLRLCFSFKVCVYVLPFGYMEFLCSFGFAHTAIWKRRGVRRTKGQGGVVAGKSVSHHHCHSAWQKTELQLVYGDTGMMETDWAMGAYGDLGWRIWTE
jgi:hypothetical protein